MSSKILVETELVIPIYFDYSYMYAATSLHVHNDEFLPNIFNNCKYQLPDDGHRPKHVAAF
jgi:hypothetical protein